MSKVINSTKKYIQGTGLGNARRGEFQTGGKKQGVTEKIEISSGDF